jgi:Ca2+/Na+ antiporter
MGYHRIVYVAHYNIHIIYNLMRMGFVDFWNYLHFLLLVSIFILILKDRKKLKKERKNQDDKSIWFNIKK